MSITLITAAPGAGKTAHVVWNIIRPASDEGRIIYTAGIPGLQYPTISRSYQQVKKWHEREQIEVANEYQRELPDDEIPSRLLNFTEGSLIVIDECQFCWPAAGSREPSADITYLTKHRHHGLEIVLLTQAPQLVHKNVLAVVDKHIHMVVDWTGRKMYEWPEYCSTPRAVSSKIRAVSKRYDVPKKVHGMYRSASMHVKPERRKPVMFFLFPFLLLALPAMIYGFYQRVYVDKGITETSFLATEQKETTNNQIVMNDEKTHHTPAPVPVQPQPQLVPVTLNVVTDRVDWSKVMTCVASDKQCICYGHSAHRLAIPADTCRIALKNGWPRFEEVRVQSSPIKS